MKVKVSMLLLGFLLLILVALIGGRLPYFLMYVYSGILLLPFIHSLIGKHKIQASITLPNRDLVAGDVIELRTEFVNPTRYIFPRLEYKSTLTELLSDQLERPKTFHLSPNESFVDVTLIQCRRRGVYSSGETELVVKDVFNLFQFKKSLQAPIALKIYPRLLPLSDFSVEAGIYMGDLIVEDPLFQDYSSIDALRGYRDGDSVKKIHWKASAKQDQLIVKEFEFRGDAEVLLLLDQSLANYRHDTYRKIEDRVVEVGVSITHYCLLNHLKINYMSSENNSYHKITGSSDTYLKVFLEEFVAFRPIKTTTLRDDIQHLRPRISQGNTLIVVTPKLTVQLATELLDLKMTNRRPMAFVIMTSDEASDAYQEQLNLIGKLEAEYIPIIKISL